MQQKQATAPRSPGASGRWVVGFSCLNLVLLSLVNYALYFVSETWWVGSVLTYSPRVLFLIPTLFLIVASLLWRRLTLGMNLVAAVIVLVPVMGLSLPLDLWLNGSPTTEGELVLKVVSCNVQSYEPDFKKVLDEIEDIKPDVVAMQEAFGDDDRVDQFFREWHTVRQGQYRVFSRYRVSLIAGCEVTQFGGRLAGIVVQIEAPGGAVILGDIHQMTARIGLEELDHESVLSGKGTKGLRDFVEERSLESAAIRTAVDSAHSTGPLIVCGDFNTPTFSMLFQKHWGDLKSSFDAAAFGYGYTSPCTGNRIWPDNTPWARIDHILCSHEWSVRACKVGRSDGSDHRLIAATLVLKAEIAH
jgi:endonuclease/exonuclease/phosphatase family metal-dependent hydrolase